MTTMRQCNGIQTGGHSAKPLTIHTCARLTLPTQFPTTTTTKNNNSDSNNGVKYPWTLSAYNANRVFTCCYE